MEIVFEELGLKVAPHGGGLCYEMFEWKDGGEEYTVKRGERAGQKAISEAGWRSMGRYPSTVESAVETVYEFAILRKQRKTTNKELVKELTELRASILSAVRRAKDASSLDDLFDAVTAYRESVDSADRQALMLGILAAHDRAREA